MVVVVGSEEGKREKRWVDEEGSTPNHHLAITKRTKQARKGKLQKTEQQPCAGQEGAQQHTGDDWQSRKERSSSSSRRRRRSMMMVVDDPSLAQPEVPSPQHSEQDSGTMSQSEGLTGSSELCPTRPAACMACIEWGEGESVLADLSDELMLAIFKSGLSSNDLYSVSLVCRRWWALSQDHLLRRSLCKGKVFVFGGGEYGQLGLGHRNDQPDKPVQIRTLNETKVKGVFAARRHSVVLDSEGQVFSFGSGEDGKLGHGNELDQLVPKQITAIRNCRVVNVSCGAHHTLLVTDSGRLFSFGFAACGQLGHGDQTNRAVPTEVRSLSNERVVNCAAGAHHSLAVTDRGGVYSFGLGHTGQLGHGEENTQLITYQLTPKRVRSIQGIKIVSAAAGFFNSLLVSDDGQLFTFGSGGNGKLGHGDQANQLLPKRVLSLASQRVVQASAGPCHTLALTDRGKVFSFGNPQCGRLGHGDDQPCFYPCLVQTLLHEKIRSVSAGECYSLALTEDGRVFFFGSMMGAITAASAYRHHHHHRHHHRHRLSSTGNDNSRDENGQLCPNTTNSVVGWLEVGRHHRVKEIAAGGHHSLLKT